MILADFHMHSTFSDGKLTIPELVDLFGKRGFGAIGITDHLCESESVIGKAARYLERTLTAATFPLYLEILKSEAERAWEQYRMVVIPGVELTKNTVTNQRSAHILGLGISKWLTANGDPVELARSIRKQGALAIAAHPVHTRKREKQTYYLWDRRRELAQELDAWEVASGPYLFDEVMQSGLPMIASSDMHRPEQMTSWKTVLDCERHPQAILEAIRKQELKFMFYNEERIRNDDVRNLIDVSHLGARARANDLGRLLST
jgi:predicted metal-dependent phosphoesterase TrpH